MRPALLNPLFSPVTTLSGVGPKQDGLFRYLLGRNDTPRLVGYVVPDRDWAERRDGAEDGRQIASWQEVYESVYRDQAERGGFWDDFGIWTSSYDGSPIPLAEMREWRAAAVERILGLEPRNVLERGVGNGLILSQVAPHCAAYLGTDNIEVPA